jgi:O-antigen/teichoic acid export membrane protein
MFLVIAQAVVTPISVVVNAVAARFLGPADYGRMYLALTYATFAFLFVEWGQSATITGSVARNRARAGELLGSGLTWRVAAAIVVAVLLPLLTSAFGAEPQFIPVLRLTLITAALTTVALACQDVFRGFERTDFAALSYIGFQIFTALVVVPTLMLGGDLHALLVAQIVCAAFGAGFVLRMLRRMQVPRLIVRRETIKELLVAGQPFLIFGLIIALQPLVDGLMLDKFGSSQAMGWYAASRKLIGILIYPATALSAALYPTLCRLRQDDRAAFRASTADSLRVVTIAVVPVALGCALFPDIGVAIFSADSYGPAQDNLRVLAIYILLVYFTMPLGTCLAASGKQMIWAIAQFGCVIVSALCDPPFIRWFDAHTGNGGLGVCVAVVVSEVLMVGAGLYLLPGGILDKALLRRLAAALLAGSAMALVAWLLLPLNSFVRAGAAVATYLVAIWLLRAITVEELRALPRAIRGR